MKTIYVTKINVQSFNKLIDLGFTIIFISGSIQ
jgi:hypothetical protein